jgi:hypothetical protein
MDAVNKEISDRLKAALEGGISEDTIKPLKKAVDDILCRIEDDIMYRMKDDLAPNLVSFVAEMASETVGAILGGNEDMMRQYLGCRIGHWTGRSDSPVWGREREASEWHPVIHGELFLQGAVKLRRDIVAAHPDLITNERIKDLEDQVVSLVAQLNKANKEKDAMWERVRQSERG